MTLWRWAAARRYTAQKKSGDVGRELRTGKIPALPCSLLKPVKGVEADTRKCLQSWLEQEYDGELQFLFGVASADDPVCALINELLAEFPKVNARLVVCSQSLAINRKVSTLIQLEPLIVHPIVVISDADVSVPRDFLQKTVPRFDEPVVGLVHSLYRLANPTTVAMHWEAIGVNADFWSEVLQSRSIKDIDFALGATMLLPRIVLKKLGGFASLASYLADDYQLGRQISRLGKKIVFSGFVVDCWESSHSWSQVWHHQLRWARTIRVCQPVPYFASILNNSSLWPILWLGWMALFGPSIAGMVICLFCLGFRIGTALDLQYRHTNSHSALPYWWLVPIKDLLHVMIWAGAFVGNRITWRGDAYRVLPGGKLEPRP